MDWTVGALQAAGFEGFVPLLTLNLPEVPDEPGVYCVVRPDSDAVQFLEESVAGWWKDRDPSVTAQVLEEAWIEGPAVVYIGKASASLRQRLRPYRRIGEGYKAAHWGGRYIWQLADHRSLLVCWRTEADDAAVVESRLIAEFRTAYGDRPFANLVK
ncbi:hypothetical protein [Aeromicrobium sp. Root344]|uniref:hypothetical protein n=1 Tax=Aeromicrobium sp. Root344 TaxID=1736521 RepID=UPI0012FA2BD2|nr:hypothetical protein [Aeromicrobium sp. Root344]